VFSDRPLSAPGHRRFHRPGAVTPSVNRTLLTALLLGTLVLAPPNVAAQRAGENDERAAREPATARTPTIRQSVWERLTEAQVCLEEAEDLTCVFENLERLRARTDLTSFEAAQMWTVYAHAHLARDDFPEAIRAFESVLAQDGLTPGVEQSTTYVLAALYVQEERYTEGLEMLERWFGAEQAPSSAAYYLKAQTHYQLGDYAEAVEPTLAAIRVAEEQDNEPQEGWYQLLYILYFELENYPKVIETLTFVLEHWTRRDYLMQLAAVYNQEGRESSALALYEAAYEMSWLERGTDLVNFARMLMNADIPYKAAGVMQAGLDAGVVEPTEANWRLLAQAWQSAQEDDKALTPLATASSLAADGELDLLLAQSHLNLARWDECIETARNGLERGLARAAQLNVLLGSCLAALKRYPEARAALGEAARLGDERTRRSANEYLVYIESEEAQQRYMRETIEALEQRSR
jgi:tetratricopeptide (TPR) repeat protein